MTTNEEHGSKEVTPKPEEEDSDDDDEDLLVFTPYTAASWDEQLDSEKNRHDKEVENKKHQGEAHLVDGELQFVSEEHHGHQETRNPNLVEGNTLKEDIEPEFPKDLYGKPVEEFDKLIKERDKTFCVVGPRFKREYIYRFSATPSFYVLRPWNPFRKFCVYIATSQYFDYFIILTILANCIFLAMPNEPASETAEYVFLGVYTLEMIIKLSARGFFINSYTYLRDAWNWLDFIVIVSAYFTIVLENTGGQSSLGNLQGIRTFRVFRVLRTISIIPGLKTIVNALLRAFRMLLEVMMLICFCLMVFALFSLQIYMGSLRQKCVTNLNYSLASPPAYTYDQYFNDHTKNSFNWYMEGEYLCGNTSGAQSCPDGYTCFGDIGENPRWGFVSFDHFGWAMLTSFQLMTLDFWEDTYNKVLQTSGPLNVIFFILVIFFGSFYLVNLMLAVVAMSYEQESEAAGKEKAKEIKNKERNKKRKKKKEKEKKEKDALRDLANEQSNDKNKHDHHKKHPDDADYDDPWIHLRHETTNAVRAAVEMAYPSNHASKKIPTSSTARPLGNPNHVSQTDNKDSKHIKRNPMVKMASKDSGTGNSVESSRSNGSKDEYTLMEDGSYPGSTIDIIKRDSRLPTKKPLLKQQSTGMVSSSGVTLSPYRVEENNTDHLTFDGPNDYDNTDDTNTNAMEEESPGRKYVREKYPHLTIVDVGDGDPYIEREEDQVVNRNCNSCYNVCGGRLFVGWLWYQQFCFTIISEPMFDLFIIVCITLNTLFMSLEHYPQTDTFSDVLSVANYIFSTVFILEAVLKLSALTKHYFKNSWNIFDLVIVVISIFDLTLTNVDGLSVIRIFRLLRVFKLAQSWGTMRLLLSIIMNTLGALGNLTLILLIVIYIFAVVGLQLFNDKYTPDKFDGEVIRWHFKDIFHAFMMIFRVLCGEWIEPLWDCMRAADELCMAVFLPTLVLGYFIVLNLFLALLLNAFASDTLREAKESSDENDKLKLAFSRLYNLFCCCLKKKNGANAVSPDTDEDGNEVVQIKDLKVQEEKESLPAIKNGVDKKTSNGLSNKDSKNVDKAFATKRDQFDDFAKTMQDSKGDKTGKPAEVETTKDTVKILNEQDGEEKKKEEGVTYYTVPKKTKQVKTGKDKNKVDTSLNVPRKDQDDMELGAEASTIKKDAKKHDGEEEEEDKVIEVHACWPVFCAKRFEAKNRCVCCWLHNDSTFWDKWFKLRVFMNIVVDHKIFEGIILLSIAVSSITLAFEDVNLYKNIVMQQALYWLNLLFAVIFGVEMFMKWIAFGFKKYFTSFWCLLDFVIVVISVASIVAEAYGAANLSAFRSLRTLRALRPLRAISRWQGMRIVVNALMMAIPAIMNVLLVCLLFWLIFSIMGVQFFRGKFYKCLDSNGDKLSNEVVANKAECLAMEASHGYKWENSPINFDNVFSGFLALFQVATFEGWMEVMEDAVDSADIDEQPSFENSLYSYLFFVAFIIFGAFFTLNLFIGVIIDNFNMLKKKYDGNYLDMFLTSGQRQYYNTIKKLGNKKPQKTIKRPKYRWVWLNKIQGVFYDIAISSKFELCIVIVIFLNMIQMAVDHYGQTQAVTDVLSMLNMLFVVIFTLEAIVKIIGLRWHYFTQPWNIFDFVVVIISLLGIILSDIMSNVIVSPTLLRVVRVFRIGRVLRLIRAAKGIRKLLFALIISLPALLNIGMLLFLIMYIYAIICLSQFQNLKIEDPLDEDVVNFRTFGNSFLLMFRLSTAAGWNDILGAMMIAPPNCNNTHYQQGDEWIENSPGNCGTSWLAVFALTTYILIIFLVVINMFIAVILENFNQAHEQEEVGITEDDFDMFYAIWERYDPLATQFIKYEQLSNFVADLEPPLGISKPNEIALVSFDLPITEGDKLHCLDVLMALVRYVLGNVEESDEFRQLHEQMEQKFQSAFPTRVNTTKKTTTMMRKKEDVAAKTLQRAWRSWKAQKQMKNIATLAMQQKNQSKSGTSIEPRNKNSSIRNLGTRLTTALSAFFSSSRPSSAVSQLSIKSSNPSIAENNASTSKQKKAQSAMNMPNVSTLYGPGRDNDIEL
ncbi:sodium channel protein 1 brain-like isoform X3 [Mya arenaria]|uniref:sodium channel protein 1 brain-like isoform X3 n=1 Tax=Mya arenaria TaxID=6604 RepID=UPI0022E9595C|nr:sodium channel protein 1 brain-like isoform X3 [Mya arenaria]